MRKTDARRTMARARATRWRCPPEQGAWLAIEELGQPEHGGRLAHQPSPLRLVDVAGEQRELDVLAHRLVRVERVALEHHRDVPVLGLDAGDHLAADAHRAVGGLVEPGDHAQRGGLPAAGRAEEHEELAIGHVEREVVDGDDVAEALGHGRERDRGHSRARLRRPTPSA
jgi:hypothetical protein